MSDAVLALEAIRKNYGEGAAEVEVLKGIDFHVRRGEYVSIMGPSGSGKSTLLNILGCLDRPTDGSYFLEDRDVARLNDNQLSDIRNRNIGFVFQSFNLIPQLTVLENVEVPLYYGVGLGTEAVQRCRTLLDTVGLSHRLTHRPSQLSGGERQRVAIARALANDPSLILADEPTGNLDSKTGQGVLALLEELNGQGRTIVIITHDPRIASQADRTITLFDGEGRDVIGRILLTLRLGVRNLLGYPLRTLLTTLGIIFGVGAVIAMMAISAGAEKALLEEIGRLGIRNIILNTVKPPEKREDTQTNTFAFNRYGLTFKDQAQIETTIPGLADVLPVHARRRTVWNGSRKLEATVYAVRPRHMELFGLEVIRGRNLTALDGVQLKRICVIRAGLLRQLGIFEDPIDRYLLVGDHYYRIVGVLASREFLGYAQKALAIDSKTSEIYMPYETISRRLGTRTIVQRQGSREATDVELSQLVVAVKDIESALTTSRMLKRVLDRNHEDKDYEIVVPLEELAQRRNTQRIFKIVLISIASISLLVGGIGIANIMLATVTERTREIGIRRALGAKRRHITAQFLAETTLISTLGGVLGVAFGFLLIQMLTAFAGYSAIVSPEIIVLALGISTLVGIVFGIFPARRAAMLDPIAALRHE